MRKMTRLKIGPAAVLVLLALLVVAAVYRARHTDEEPVGTVVKLGDRVVHDSHATVAVVGLVALFAFVVWTALRANEREDKARPSAREPSASDSTAPR
jgi:protein-S-isoprenylcysteine O-methyltransferase Ste14